MQSPLQPDFRVGVLTVSDRSTLGEYVDESGPRLTAILDEWEGFAVDARLVVADEQQVIEETLRTWADNHHLDLILTTGGTGLSPRDVTPEATHKVIDREIPGIAEFLRMKGTEITLLATLSRQVAGQRANTLIINLPGSPSGAVENLELLAGILQHALAQVSGQSHG